MRAYYKPPLPYYLLQTVAIIEIMNGKLRNEQLFDQKIIKGRLGRKTSKDYKILMKRCDVFLETGSQ